MTITCWSSQKNTSPCTEISQYTAELLLLPVSENGRPPYWDYTGWAKNRCISKSVYIVTAACNIALALFYQLLFDNYRELPDKCLRTSCHPLCSRHSFLRELCWRSWSRDCTSLRMLLTECRTLTHVLASEHTSVQSCRKLLSTPDRESPSPMIYCAAILGKPERRCHRERPAFCD